MKMRGNEFRGIQFQSGNTSTPKRFSLTDWLRIHEIDKTECADILVRSGKLSGASETDAAATEMTAEAAWALAATALKQRFPEAEAMIDETAAKAEVDFNAASGRPMTIPHTDPGRAIVRMNFQGRAKDVLTIAHEFGHTAQLMAVGQDFVPPIMREVSAFLAEHAVLDWLSINDRRAHTAIFTAWVRANDTYVTGCGGKLRCALDGSGAHYHYDWNYPIARTIASEAFDAVPARALFRVYQNRISLSGLNRFLGCERRTSPACDGACLAFLPGTIPEAEIPLL